MFLGEVRHEGRLPLLMSWCWGLEMPNEGRGGRALSLPPLCSARNALGRRPRSPPIAAAPIWERRVLRGGRALRGAAPLELLFMPGNDHAVIPGSLDHSRAQDFGITVGRERISAIKLPLRPPSWPRPVNDKVGDYMMKESNYIGLEVPRVCLEGNPFKSDPGSARPVLQILREELQNFIPSMHLQQLVSMGLQFLLSGIFTGFQCHCPLAQFNHILLNLVKVCGDLFPKDGYVLPKSVEERLHKCASEEGWSLSDLGCDL
ncbi:hypothetical protein NDU88_006383 [Pleurodeles waltl]|uniref:Uncharacterized protein n=1 Tax=Pleurodeles waltl TaxID=8319 RepID=A0AAV7SPL4_PLEWA|nr:hypothetical protein NDU88_006383 [Pleurodeles waltl]